MTPDYNICDMCRKAQTPKHTTLFIATGRQMDGAGDSETVGEHIDLCNRCALLVIDRLLHTPSVVPSDYEAGKTILKIVKGAR